MKTSVQLILAILVIVLSGSGTSFAADARKPAKDAEKPTETTVEKEKPAAKDEAAPKKNSYPLYGQVISADASTLTIKGGEGKEARKFSVGPDTVIVKGDKPATIEEIKPGQWIGGKIEKSTEGNDKVLKLNLEVKQKEAKPEAKPVANAETKEEGKEEVKPKATKKKES